MNTSIADSNITESLNSEKTSGTSFHPALISGTSLNYHIIWSIYMISIEKTISAIIIGVGVIALIIAFRKTCVLKMYSLLK